ncbi:hypothetical protein ACOBQX_00510 [Actinokineospora sp. G85]|uniref:hypothetical protein n=1 Tax=Actinokineospora sp. G85 TaxID=3406626 RepID=UPI003C761670
MPVRVDITGVTGIAAFGSGAYATDTTGSVLAWGDNHFSQLGPVPDPTITQSTRPLRLAGVSGAGTLTAGGYGTAFLRS